MWVGRTVIFKYSPPQTTSSAWNTFKTQIKNKDLNQHVRQENSIHKDVLMICTCDTLILAYIQWEPCACWPSVNFLTLALIPLCCVPPFEGQNLEPKTLSSGQSEHVKQFSSTGCLMPSQEGRRGCLKKPHMLPHLPQKILNDPSRFVEMSLGGFTAPLRISDTACRS